MVNHQKYIVIVVYILFIVSILWIATKVSNNYESFEDCDNTNDINDIPESASEACKRISTRAEEIEADYKGKGEILKNIPFYSLFNPNNYRAGDTTSTDMGRNIINNNLSSCEVAKISNMCNNTSKTVQSNTIDNTMCKYCETNLCSISGVEQVNSSEVEQQCTLQLGIKALSEKKGSVDAQALAQVLQKTEGLLSGTASNLSENCNIVDQDLSSKSYIESKVSCINDLDLLQENTVKFCGNVVGVIQKNSSKQLQKCLQMTEKVSEEKIEADTNASAESDVSQSTEGITALASAASAVSSVLVSSSVAIAAYFYLNQEI